MRDISLAEIIDLLPEKTSLFYCDRGENLEYLLEEAQEQISNPSSYALQDKVDEVLIDNDSDSYAIEYYLNELKSNVSHTFDIEDEEAETIIKENLMDIEDEIRSRDESSYFEDALRNTPSQVFLYDLNTYINDYTDSLSANLRQVKKAIGIKLKDKTYDKALSEMIMDASYGGKLVVYFYHDLDEWLKDTKANFIKFSGNISLAIVDHLGGSGGDTSIKYEFSVPFDRSNLFLDKLISYNYTYEVCGMIPNWCEGTEVKLFNKRSTRKANKSSISEEINKEKEYQRIYNEGGCSYSDAKFSRHDTEYINNYPCGWHCKNCKRFWID